MTTMVSLAVSKVFFFIIASALVCCMQSTLALSIGTRRMLEDGTHRSSVESDEDAAFAKALDSSHESLAWGLVQLDDAVYAMAPESSVESITSAPLHSVQCPLHSENSAFTTSSEVPPKPDAFPPATETPLTVDVAFPMGMEPPKPPSADVAFATAMEPPPSVDVAFRMPPML